MLYLAIIFHMHQPYYKDLLTQEAQMPWVRLHGIKDYLDMLKVLERYPKIQLTFNLVPSLLEQIEDYTQRNIKDKFWELSYRPAAELTAQDKEFILESFFMINREQVISFSPRYYELYFKKEAGGEFATQDYLDLQVWFNLAWIDPYFRQNIKELKDIVDKARLYNEEDKRTVLDKQLEILEEIIPTYREFMSRGQIEITTNPYYHPILPLLYDTNIAKEANFKTMLPEDQFSYPQDARQQIMEGVRFYQSRFGGPPKGMWPSEEAVSDHIVPLIIQSKVEWIVADEGVLFRSLKIKKRDTRFLYQPHILRRKQGNLNIVFRDRNLSDLIGFVYHRFKPEVAVVDLLKHLENIANVFRGQDTLVTIAMDGENAWEYYRNDGHDFLELLYQKLSEADFIKVTGVSEYLKQHPAQHQIRRLAAGSWIYGEFSKWINNPLKSRAWECLLEARRVLDEMQENKQDIPELAWKQIYICEGSDWFWWYGDNHEGFDRLFRKHLENFYTLVGRKAPDYLARPLTAGP